MMRLDSVCPPLASDGALSALYLADETALMARLIGQTGLSQPERDQITKRAAAMAQRLRDQTGSIGFVDALMQEYGLSSTDGIALMRLAEALIRTPDPATAIQLVRDKFMNRTWGEHAGNSPSFMVNLATRGMQFASLWVQLTGGVQVRAMLARLGDRVFLAAMNRAMALIGEHFVLGHDIQAACAKARHHEKAGYGFSYDMLGEAALTDRDAEQYFRAYTQAVRHLASIAGNYTFAMQRPSISIKLSALHPRYEYTQADRCVPPLVSKLITLAQIAKEGGIGITIDAEEADRLEVSLMVLEALLMAPELSGWDGLGFVVQAYQRRALAVLDHLIQRAEDTQRRLNVRLVKGAYWDMELKRAQELGLPSYPVFTRKDYTDVSYLACAQKMLGAPEQIYSQFATHNAQTALAVDYMAKKAGVPFEFQRLHGMGERLHAALIEQGGVSSRIYAPVGQHRDLLPYLVRRLLENGANSSFVNQLTDNKTDIQSLVRDPIESAQTSLPPDSYVIPEPQNAFGMTRLTARGVDWTQAKEANALQALLAKAPHYVAASIIGGREVRGPATAIRAPFDQNIEIGEAFYADTKAIDAAIDLAQRSDWVQGRSRAEASACLRKAADLLEAQQDEFTQLCVWEAGKTIADAIAEIREAVDFCRYYADQAEALDHDERAPLGIVACISPWNFPLAIFIGQIVAALAAGNTVIAKPAEQTPLIAHRVVKLLHEAGIPVDTLHLVIGDGATLGNYLSAHALVKGICFTGSTRTAKTIANNLADTGRALVPLIAETGGVNAMIIDSTALLEQAVSDMIASAFHSAGQRCSSCRLVCIQDDMADAFTEMLSGAMDTLVIAAPTKRQCDIGPVIDAVAKTMIETYVEKMRGRFNVLGETPHAQRCRGRSFCGPHRV
ncbi:MAG: bifunctional proline dehydrogenase/L-glutamate gamma-semialdehyde dehydrogenase PutA [Robiginitomaculum sp.]|nr:bifunctional proline dehydrogenase/L-glutamate gamma-semialdehyde dehydrogenase PutA [Robiginitomaculum sp.]